MLQRDRLRLYGSTGPREGHAVACEKRWTGHGAQPVAEGGDGLLRPGGTNFVSK